MIISVVFGQVVSFGRLNLSLFSATHLSQSDWVGQVNLTELVVFGQLVNFGRLDLALFSDIHLSQSD